VYEGLRGQLRLVPTLKYESFDSFAKGIHWANSKLPMTRE